MLALGRDDAGLPETLFSNIDCAVVWMPHAGARQTGAPSSVRVSPGTDDDGLAAVEQAVAQPCGSASSWSFSTAVTAEGGGGSSGCTANSRPLV